VKESCGENLHHLLGQLSWLSEEACSSRQVLALTNSLDVVSDQTTDRVLMLNRVKRALDEDGLRLYAQPIHNAKGEGYYEILSRLESDGEIIMPDQFIPVVAQFNLSQRFDMSVLEALVKWLHAHPANDGRPRFSVNLMPLTLMQKEVAADIIALFKHYSVDPQTVIIEVTEEQAFSHSGSSIHNIQQLRDFGFKIAIDDFGTFSFVLLIQSFTCGAPGRLNCASLSCTRDIAAMALSAGVLLIITANSSPPNRPIMSLPRRVNCSWRVIATMASSPMSWPQVSLMVLK
jgi:hypothetical protein